jgi:hypothetical protein
VAVDFVALKLAPFVAGALTVAVLAQLQGVNYQKGLP